MSAAPSKKKKRANSDDDAVEVGSGNVFADIGLPSPEVALAKAKLVQRIRRAIRDGGYSDASAAKAMGLDPHKVSALVAGGVAGYGLERLLTLLTRLGQTVEITIRTSDSEAGERFFVTC